MPALNFDIAGSCNIPLPPLTNQQQIVDEMNAKNEYIKLTEQMIKKQELAMKKIVSSIWSI